MNYWLFKSEPDEYSIDDLAAEVVRAAYPDPAQFDPASKYFDPRPPARRRAGSAWIFAG